MVVCSGSLRTGNVSLPSCSSFECEYTISRSLGMMTFTSGYGKHAGRAGAVLRVGDDEPLDADGNKTARFRAPRPGERLRYFTPAELLRLHGFPEAFSFGPIAGVDDDSDGAGLTPRQCWKLIGNSVSVVVVAELLRALLREGEGERCL